MVWPWRYTGRQSQTSTQCRSLVANNCFQIAHSAKFFELNHSYYSALLPELFKFNFYILHLPHILMNDCTLNLQNIQYMNNILCIIHMMQSLLEFTPSQNSALFAEHRNTYPVLHIAQIYVDVIFNQFLHCNQNTGRLFLCLPLRPILIIFLHLNLAKMQTRRTFTAIYFRDFLVSSTVLLHWDPFLLGWA